MASQSAERGWGQGEEAASGQVQVREGGGMATQSARGGWGQSPSKQSRDNCGGTHPPPVLTHR